MLAKPSGDAEGIETIWACICAGNVAGPFDLTHYQSARSEIALYASRLALSVSGGRPAQLMPVLFGDNLSAMRRWSIVAVVLVAAFFIQMPIVLNADLGWLLTLDEKLLQGRTLAVDIYESNPPLSVYMYMPAVSLGRLMGVAPEFIVIALVVVEIACALSIVDRAAAMTKSSEAERNISIWALACLLAILPGPVFGQREHIAVIALTPFVAIAAMRWRDADPGRVAILAGLGAGLAICIKPYFALVVGPPIILNVIRQRSLKPLFVSEVWAATFIVICYAAVIRAIFPAYLFNYVWMVNEAYLPIRRGWGDLIVIPIPIIGASLCILRLMAVRNVRIWSEATPWFVASLGGAATFLLQGKGWPYTALALCVFSMAAPLVNLSAKTLSAPLLVVGAGMFELTGLFLSLPAPGFPPLKQHIEALASHPRLLTITDHIGLGHPLVRQLHGSWVGASCAQLLSGGVLFREKYSRPTQSERLDLDRILHFEQRQLAADLRDGDPDIILVDTYLFSRDRFDWLAWANSDPEIRNQLERYHEVEDVGRVRIFARLSHPHSPN